MELRRDLARKVDSWLKEDSERNPNLLAQQSGVSYPTIRRIIGEELVPSLDTVLSLLPHIMPDDDARRFLLEHFPAHASFFESASCRGIGGLLCKEDFILLTLARRKSGCQHNEAQDRLGCVETKRSMERLLKMGLIRPENGRYFATKRPISGALDEDIHHMGIAVQCLSFERLAEPGNVYELLNTGLNEKGIALADRIFRVCRSRLRKLYGSEEYRGNGALVSVLAISRVD